MLNPTRAPSHCYKKHKQLTFTRARSTPPTQPLSQRAYDLPPQVPPSPQSTVASGVWLLYQALSKKNIYIAHLNQIRFPGNYCLLTGLLVDFLLPALLEVCHVTFEYIVPMYTVLAWLMQICVQLVLHLFISATATLASRQSINISYGGRGVGG